MALAAEKGDKTLLELASQFEIHANQVSAWRKELIDRAAELFEDGRRRQPDDGAANQQELYEQIGRLKKIFPNGVCDYRRPGMGQQTSSANWRHF